MTQQMGKLFIVAAPSGGGKTSLVKALLRSLDNIAISISHTTRPKRTGEVDGVDYFFVNEQRFMSMVDESQFIEHARVFDYYYGTSVAEVRERLASGIDVILDIDWQGAAQIRYSFPEAVSIFLLPPSIEALSERLQARQRDPEDVIQKRMLRAQDEMSHYPEFDYLIVNDIFSEALDALRSIVVSHRLLMARQCIVKQQLLSNLLRTQ